MRDQRRRDTAPERRVRAVLTALGARYRVAPRARLEAGLGVADNSAATGSVDVDTARDDGPVPS